MGCCRHVPVSRQVLADRIGLRPFPTVSPSSSNHPHNDERSQVRLIRCIVPTYGIDKECKTHSPMIHAIVCFISSRIPVLSMQDRIGIIELSKVSHRIGSSTRFASHRRLNNSLVSFTPKVETGRKCRPHPVICTIVCIISSRISILFMQNRIEIIELSRCHKYRLSRLRDSPVTVDLIVPPITLAYYETSMSPRVTRSTNMSTHYRSYMYKQLLSRYTCYGSNYPLDNLDLMLISIPLD